MTKEDFVGFLESLQTDETVLRESGQREYAHDPENCFANFERVGISLGIPREKVLLVYAMKHMDGIVAYVNGHTSCEPMSRRSQREAVHGRILDLRVYLALLAGMLKEEECITGV